MFNTIKSSIVSKKGIENIGLSYLTDSRKGNAESYENDYHETSVEMIILITCAASFLIGLTLLSLIGF